MRVLIVDDEAVVRVGLKSMIDWKANGYDLVGEAENGEKALEIIMEEKPQIVITDIKMPVMDGLELISRINEMEYRPYIVVLSSYDDFQLVKMAMKLGAVDYLLKLEVESYELMKILGEISKRDQYELSIQAAKKEIDHQIVKNIPALRENMLKEVLCNDVINEKDFEESMKFLDIKLVKSYVFCIILRIGSLLRFNNIAMNEPHIINLSIVNISNEVIADDLVGYCINIEAGELCILASLKNNNHSEPAQAIIENTCQRLADILKQYLNIRVVIGVGEAGAGISGLRESFRQAEAALNYSFFFKDRKVILYNEIKSLPPLDDTYSILGFKDNIHRELSLRNEKGIRDIFAQINHNITYCPLSSNSIRTVITDIYYIVNDFFKRYRIDIKESLGDFYYTYEHLIQINNMEEIQEWIKNIEEKLVSFINRRFESDYSFIIEKAKEFIYENYAKDISLSDVADKVHLNASYLSTLFKQFTGMSYTEFITDIRIEKSKELLSDPKLKIYEISNLIGYDNIYYFNRIFKKITGMTPLEFRNTIKVQ